MWKIRKSSSRNIEVGPYGGVGEGFRALCDHCKIALENGHECKPKLYFDSYSRCFALNTLSETKHVTYALRQEEEPSPPHHSPLNFSHVVLLSSPKTSEYSIKLSNLSNRR